MSYVTSLLCQSNCLLALDLISVSTNLSCVHPLHHNEAHFHQSTYSKHLNANVICGLYLLLLINVPLHPSCDHSMIGCCLVWYKGDRHFTLYGTLFLITSSLEFTETCLCLNFIAKKILALPLKFSQSAVAKNNILAFWLLDGNFL